MPIVILILSIVILGVILSAIDRHSMRGKQLLTYFYLAVAVLSFLLTRNILTPLLFGVFALWNWTAYKRLQAGYSASPPPASTKRSKARNPNLPSGCPPNCTEADLMGLDLREANFRGANLQGANLFVTDLRRANLGGANLSEVDLGGANLHGADLRQANLDGADLRGAKYDDTTIWPTNFNPSQAGAIRKE